MVQRAERMGNIAGEELISKIDLKNGRRAKKASLSLTNLRVFMTKSDGVFGELDVSIPINAIDSFRFGWVRIRLLLIAAVVAIACGGYYSAFGVSDDLKNSGYVSLGVGLLFLVIFFLYRPTELIVRSGLEKAGGMPRSHQEAKEIVRRLMLEISKTAK